MTAKMTVGTTENPKNNTLSLLVDTGSSWNWVLTCNKNIHQHWAGKECPYFDDTQSTSLGGTGRSKTITYAGNITVGGPVVNDYLEVFGSKEMKARLPFILSR